MTNLDQPWRGSWKLVEHRGFREWLTHRGATADDATGPVSFTAHVDDDTLVLIGGPMGWASETHGRRVVDHQLVQIMCVEGAADDSGSWCELVWERS